MYITFFLYASDFGFAILLRQPYACGEYFVQVYFDGSTQALERASTSRSKERESGRATLGGERRGDLRRDRDDQVRRTGSLA